MATDMKGSLSHNQKRETDRHPEFKGSCMVAGVEYWLSAWVREGDDGSKYFSLAFKPKEQPQQQASPELKQKYAPNTNGQRTDHRRGVRDEVAPHQAPRRAGGARRPLHDHRGRPQHQGLDWEVGSPRARRHRSVRTLADLGAYQGGLAAAKDRGAVLGRRRKLAPADIARAKELLAAGDVKAPDVAAMYDVSTRTLFRELRNARDREGLTADHERELRNVEPEPSTDPLTERMTDLIVKARDAILDEKKSKSAEWRSRERCGAVLHTATSGGPFLRGTTRMPTDMKGSLSRNQKRETDRYPEFKGSAMVEGREYWLSAWVREGDDGSKYFSLAFKPKEQPHQQQASPELKQKYAPTANGQRTDHRRGVDDEIPF